MRARFLRNAGLRIGFVVVAWICLGPGGTGVAFGQVPQGQQPGEVQTGPITEPRSAEQKPTGPPVPKGIQAITQQDEKCSKRLIVNPEALFGPGRWTLDSGASKTLDPLAALITKAGQHPVRIEAFTYSGASDRENQFVAERRAITVRGWLMNHGFVPENSPVEGVGKHDPAAASTETHGSADPTGRQDNRVEVVIETCK
jgi:outer membrane protein OmpA-like peptidoglycan-associated protein